MADLPEPSDDDDAIELASRYVDGDLDASERTAAEADPDVMGWVERFGGLRTALAAPVAADATARDTAIATALAAFDEQPAAPAVSTLDAARARRARRTTRWLGAAAAVVAVAIGGAVVATNRGSSNDDLSTAETTAAAFNAETSEKAPGADDRAFSAAAPEQESAADAADADGSGGRGSGGWDMNSGAPATTAAATDTTVAGGSADTSVLASVATLQQPGDLQAFAGLPLAPIPPAEAPCATGAAGDFVGPAVYRNAPAAIYRDDGARTITAYDAATCAVLATSAYP